jgi:hypothetical protein
VLPANSSESGNPAAKKFMPTFFGKGCDLFENRVRPFSEKVGTFFLTFIHITNTGVCEWGKKKEDVPLLTHPFL